MNKRQLSDAMCAVVLSTHSWFVGLSHAFIPSQAETNNDFSLTIWVICGQTSFFNSKLILNKDCTGCNHPPFAHSARQRAGLRLFISPPLNENQRYYSHHSHCFRFKTMTGALITQRDLRAMNSGVSEWNNKPGALFYIQSRLSPPEAFLGGCTLAHTISIALFMSFQIVRLWYLTEDQSVQPGPSSVLQSGVSSADL